MALLIVILPVSDVAVGVADVSSTALTPVAIEMIITNVQIMAKILFINFISLSPILLFPYRDFYIRSTEL